jgi:hypothetical protein
MAFLVISGTTVEIDPDSWTRHENETVGREARAVAGNIRNNISSIRRRWSGQMAPLARTQLSALRDVVQFGALTTVTGDLVEGDTIQAVVAIGEAKAVRWALRSTGEPLYTASVEVKESTPSYAIPLGTPPNVLAGNVDVSPSFAGQRRTVPFLQGQDHARAHALGVGLRDRGRRSQ